MMIRTTRPGWFDRKNSPEFVELQDWMLANDVDEWLPERFAINVDGAATRGGTLTYQSFRWRRTWWGRERRGWDLDAIRPNARLADRMVPLLAPLTDRIRQVCRDLGHPLTEWTCHSALDMYPETSWE